MKKLITLALCIGIVTLGFWSYNTNVHSAKITSLETNDLIGNILKERIELKKQAVLYNSNINNCKTKLQTEKETVPLYDIPLDADLQEYIYKLSKEKNIPYELVLGVIKTESNFNPKAKNVNKNGSIDSGIMQINSCHKDLCKKLGITDLFDPYQNIRVGVELLSNIYNKYNDIHKATMIYNMGEFGAKKNWKVGRGTTNYSRKVVNNINIIVNGK